MTMDKRVEDLSARMALEIKNQRQRLSPNGTVSGFEHHPAFAELPVPGEPGIIYFVDAVGTPPVDPVDPVEPTPANALSIFGTRAPATVATHSDGGGSLFVGNWFYSTRPTGIRIVGARFWAPADAGLAAKAVTVQAWTKDWVAEDVRGLVGATLRQTKVAAGGRAQGAWAEVTFDTSFVLPKIEAGATGEDAIGIVLQYAGGNDYVVCTWDGVTTEPFNGGIGSTYLAEQAFYTGITNLSGYGGNNTNYGVDLLFEEI